MERTFTISSSPHAHGGASSARIMWTVAAALLPAAAWSVWLFGLPALQVIVATIAFSAVFEAACQLVGRRPVTLQDGSAVLTGLILALILSLGLPLWICGVGAFVAIVVAKAVFGGLGQNPFNPAMTGRVFLLIAFPAPLTRWLVPRGTGESLFDQPVTAFDAAGNIVPLASEQVDAITAATPLGLLAEKGAHAVAALGDGAAVFWGQINGSLGETSALFLLLGGVALLVTRIISWHIPVSFLATVAILALVTSGID
ncbi:MAG TPA: RnfABCDGE type electron transport complex subunit D, partial [Polyangia bacterium]|nr:RnfABCDGE type electron transport complex subunit D [Polyangia bacterium]